MIKSFQPHPTLRNTIREYYVIEKESAGEEMEFPIVDDCCHDIILFKEQIAKLYHGEDRKKLTIHHPIFSILGLEPPYKLSLKNRFSFFTIKFQPWMNNYFFGGINASGIVDLQAKYPDLKSIYTQFKHNHDLDQIIDAVNLYFLNQEVKWTAKMEFVKAICGFISDRDGMVKVSAISDHFNKSRQYINKVFKQEVKCNLKTFITAVRILTLVKQKAKSDELSLTELTYDFGYFDQAHFINDFKKVCGVTPSDYFENLPEFILRHA